MIFGTWTCQSLISAVSLNTSDALTLLQNPSISTGAPSSLRSLSTWDSNNALKMLPRVVDFVSSLVSLMIPLLLERTHDMRKIKEDMRTEMISRLVDVMKIVCSQTGWELLSSMLVIADVR